MSVAKRNHITMLKLKGGRKYNSTTLCLEGAQGARQKSKNQIEANVSSLVGRHLKEVDRFIYFSFVYLVCFQFWCMRAV